MEVLRYRLVSKYTPNLNDVFICAHCGNQFDHPRNAPGRRPKYCHLNCKQAAYRKRRGK